MRHSLGDGDLMRHSFSEGDLMGRGFSEAPSFRGLFS